MVLRPRHKWLHYLNHWLRILVEKKAFKENNPVFFAALRKFPKHNFQTSQNYKSLKWEYRAPQAIHNFLLINQQRGGLGHKITNMLSKEYGILFQDSEMNLTMANRPNRTRSNCP